MTKLRIIHSYDDGSEPVYLGMVEHVYQESTAIEMVEKAWPEFQATHPDSDCQFVKFLERYGFREIWNDVVTVTV